MKLIFTGGHHNSALELAELLREQYHAEILWLGHRHTSLTDHSDSAEFQEVTKSGIPFVDIKAGKIYKTYHPVHWLRLPYGLLQSFWHVVRYRPDMVVSFGGYLAVPVVLVASLLRIPIVTHEQTVVVGLANKVISMFAKKIFVTWPSSGQFFDSQKVSVVGLPLRKSVFQTQSNNFDVHNNLPTIFIFAGKQGSHVLNEQIRKILPELLVLANVIHQSGSNSFYNDFEQLNQDKNALDPELQSRYHLREYIFQDEIGEAYARADLVVCRAGAHTVYELAALAKPAILIPIPWVSHNEQYKNAELLVGYGGAEIVNQSELSDELAKAIKLMLKNLASYQQKAESTKSLVKFDANQQMAKEIVQLLTPTE